MDAVVPDFSGESKPPTPKVVSPSVEVPPSEGNPYFDPANVDPDYQEFWSRTGVLNRIHKSAFNNPYALLGVCLANAATHIPATTFAPSGDPINLTVGVLGRGSGSGFSTTMRHGEDALPTAHTLHRWWLELEDYLEELSEHGNLAMTLDNGVSLETQVGDILSRRGEQLLALMDGRACEGTPANSYRFTLRESVYLKRGAVWLFHPEQVAAGLPQRYLFVPLWGPHGGMTRYQDGPMFALPKNWEPGTIPAPDGSGDDLEDLRLGRGSELHRAWIRLRFKVVVCLAALHGRAVPSALDWELSLTLLRLTQRLSWKTWDLSARIEGRI